jgi:hypothetical protein
MFAVYKTICLLLFLLLSGVLIYNRLLKRWLLFSAGFFLVYVAGSYLFFRTLPFQISQDFLDLIPNLLFFGGCIACIGVCLYRQLTLSQTIGLLGCYLVLLVFILFVIGKNMQYLKEANVESLLLSAPYILFILGIPMVIGYCLYKGLCLWEAFGACAIVCSGLLLILFSASSFFHHPLTETSIQVRALVEYGSLLFLVIGLPVVIGYSLLSSEMSFKQGVGAIIVFLAMMAALIATIYFTLGYQLVPILFNGK